MFNNRVPDPTFKTLLKKVTTLLTRSKGALNTRQVRSYYGMTLPIAYAFLTALVEKGYITRTEYPAEGACVYEPDLDIFVERGEYDALFSRRH